MTLFGAGLIGAGIASLGVALFVVGKRFARARVRSTDPGPRPAPGPRAAPARPAADRSSRAAGPAHLRTIPPGVPRGRLADDAMRPTPPGRPRPPAAANPYRLAGVPEALDGETLQLGPVPAWKLPFWQGLFRRTVPVRRRGEYVSAVAGARLTEPGRAETARPAGPNEVRPGDGRTNDSRAERGIAAPAVSTNASRRHDPRTAAGRSQPGR